MLAKETYCHVCKFTYARSNGFIKHLRGTGESGDKSHSDLRKIHLATRCSYCGKEFAQSGDLKRHIKKLRHCISHLVDQKAIPFGQTDGQYVSEQVKIIDVEKKTQNKKRAYPGANDVLERRPCLPSVPTSRTTPLSPPEPNIYETSRNPSAGNNGIGNPPLLSPPQAPIDIPDQSTSPHCLQPQQLCRKSSFAHTTSQLAHEAKTSSAIG